MSAKIATLPVPSRANWSARFETQARLRFRVLVRACFATLEACADYLKVDPKSVSRWFRGARKVPAWTLMALEERARESAVVVAEQPQLKRAA
jgi:hypothetical protein